jgi:hypothetical protein
MSDLRVLLMSSPKMFGMLWKTAAQFREGVESTLHLERTSSNS